MSEPTPDQLQIAFHDVEAATYDQRFAIVYDRRCARQAVREAARLLGRRRFDRILDVGCGTGYLALSLAATGTAREVHAVDISAAMLTRAACNARRLRADIRLVRATAAALPYPDAHFDAVVTRGVLHHLHDPVAALVEWRRVARPGAPVLVLTEPSPLADRVGGAVARAVLGALAAARRLGEACGRPLSSHHGEAADLHRFWEVAAMAANLHTFTPAALRELGRASGFSRTDVRGAGLLSIVWASSYYVLAGELPDLAASQPARRRAARTWALLRRLDGALVEPLLPDTALLTVQTVYWA